MFNCDNRWQRVIALISTMMPRQNGRNFPNDIFKCISLNGNVWIAIKTSLKFVPKGPINNILALVQIMAWRWPGEKLLSEPMLVIDWRIYRRLWASMRQYAFSTAMILHATAWITCIIIGLFKVELINSTAFIPTLHISEAQTVVNKYRILQFSIHNHYLVCLFLVSKIALRITI